ncbi:putative FAD-linked oxidoreductase [Botrimarina colliarenosi]|uniref:Putative FAD-linked oxidoreductase n=1 Tax=Botrimarina colliarenosi TaxID=2528001 RepID=A0A5C6A2B0_9BACT|nr:FAD-linked oxidase C-terminal domain-containing protein [Botrimarina colliarenosi]TWT93470.1 putative FAD-linked oxidoreductase [Botrimarina colliarenosi]
MTSPSSAAPVTHQRADAALIDTLRGIVGAENVLTEPVDIEPYAFDGTAAIKQRPACVVFPRDRSLVAPCVHAVTSAGVPLVTRGSGTGLSGGSVPLDGAVTLGLNHLDQILEVDTANLTIRVEPGVITMRVDEEAAKHGLFYPPDPGSQKISTIGGNVAENSGGLRGLKYGVTRDYVMGMRVVLASGEEVWLGNQCVKDVAGYNLKDLFIGSEGTLGVITEVLLKLLPRPAARKTMVATFATIESAAQAVSDIIARKIVPCTVEFLDQMTIRCVEDYAKLGLPTDAAALLLLESDGHPVVVEEESAAMHQALTDNGATDVQTAQTEAEAEKLRTARRAAFSALARVSPTTILEDVTVPRSELAGMVRFCAECAERHQLRIGTFGHMGDGNLHPTFLTDERNEDEMRRVHEALGEIVTETLRRGGTITGEHGVGLAKKPFLRQQLGDASYDLLGKVKRALDPQGLLNPGKVFD